MTARSPLRGSTRTTTLNRETVPTSVPVGSTAISEGRKRPDRSPVLAAETIVRSPVTGWIRGLRRGAHDPLLPGRRWPRRQCSRVPETAAHCLWSYSEIMVRAPVCGSTRTTAPGLAPGPESILRTPLASIGNRYEDVPTSGPLSVVASETIVRAPVCGFTRTTARRPLSTTTSVPLGSTTIPVGPETGAAFRPR